MSKFGNALQKLQAVQPARADTADTAEPESPKAGIPESGPEREKYSTYLDSSLVTRLKIHAAQHRMKHHQVVEAALRAYLAATDPTGSGS